MIAALVTVVLVGAGLGLYTVTLRRDVEHGRQRLQAAEKRIVDLEDYEETLIYKTMEVFEVKDDRIRALRAQVREDSAALREAAVEIARLRQELLFVRLRELPVLEDVRAGAEGSLSGPRHECSRCTTVMVDASDALCAGCSYLLAGVGDAVE